MIEPASIPMRVIARIRTDFPAKFGVPRQSGLVNELEGLIVFSKEFRSPDAFRGLEEYSHIWLIWLFSEARREGFSATVRPPRLGGNRRMGVFATRSPYRPNPIGLSAVRLIAVEMSEELGVTLRVAGADLIDGTPILDIKPYLPYADAYPDARGGFTDDVDRRELSVSFPDELISRVPENKRAALLRVLAGDPRPSYQNDPARRYGFCFAGLEIKFTVRDGELTVVDVED